MRYSIILEKTTTGYSGFSPDIEGCIATGSTEDETRINLKEAIEFHLEGLQLRKQPIPSNNTISDYVDIAGF